MNNSRFKLGIAIIVAGATLFTAGMLSLSHHIDPFRLFISSRSYATRTDPVSRRISLELSSYSYVTKAKQIIREKPDVIILGSSIEDGAYRIRGSSALQFDPYPEKEQKFLALLPPGDTVYNAAIRGGGLVEEFNYLKHTYSNNPHLKKVVMGIEWSYFSTLFRNRKEGPEALAALNQTHVPLDFLLRYTISKLALKQDFYLWDTVHPTPAEKRLKAMADYLLTPDETLLPWVSSRLSVPKKPAPVQPVPPAQGAPAFSAEPDNASKPIFKPLPDYAYTNIFFSTHFINGLYHQRLIAGKKGEDVLLHPQMLDQFKQIVDFCQEKHIDLQVYLAPQPAIFWAMVRQYHLESDVERWLKAVSDITPVYDFSQYIDFLNDPAGYFPNDSMHFDENAGLILFDALFKPGSSVHPRLITRANVRESMAWRENALTQWLNAHPDVRDIVTHIPTDDASSNVLASMFLNQLTPVRYEPEYKGFGIYSLLGIYFAVPRGIAPPYDMALLLKSGYPGMLRAFTLENLTKAMDANASGHPPASGPAAKKAL